MEFGIEYSRFESSVVSRLIVYSLRVSDRHSHKSRQRTRVYNGFQSFHIPLASCAPPTNY